MSYRYIFWRYVKGGSLREYIDENKLTLPILKDLISRILSILHACQTISIQHGDLHSGNILIEDSNEMNIDPNLRRIWVTDFGYITSSMGKTPLDDLQGLVSIINDCIDSIDFHVLEGHEKYEYSQIKNEFIRKLAETNPVEYDFARSPRNLLEVFSTIIRQKLDTADQPKKKVGDYLVAENLGNRYDEWKSLFVPKFVGSEELISKSISIVTGLRGCGKTMIFRRLTGIFDHKLGITEVDGANSFIGFYINARAIAEAFPWLPELKLFDAIGQLTHYFHVCWTCEMLDWLMCVYEDSNESLSWLISFFKEYYGDSLTTTSTDRTAVLHLHAFFARERRRAKLTSVYERKGWELTDADYLEQLCSLIRKKVMSVGSKDFFFFLDDYSTPMLSPSIQRILNTIIFRRSAELYFKVATESVESILLTGLNDKYLEERDDYILIDWATEVLLRDERDNEILVEELIAPRIEWDSRISGRGLSVEKILGKTPYKYTQLAENLRSDNSGRKHKVHYCGMRTFCDMWSSSTREMIKIFAELLEHIDYEKVDGRELLVSVKDQNRVLREAGSKFRGLLVSAIDPTKQLHEQSSTEKGYGEKLQSIVDAFHEVADYELQNKTSKNQNTNPPKQARRIEITNVSELLPEDIYPYYVGLIRYGIFIRDWRGKSVRGKAVPRLILRGVLIPYYTLTFSKRDSVTLEWHEFCELLRNPKQFPSYWKNGQKQNGPEQKLLGLEV